MNGGVGAAPAPGLGGASAVFQSLVFRWVGVYVTAGFALIQALDVVTDRIGLPDRFLVGAVILAVLGLPVVAGAAAVLQVSRRGRGTAALRGSAPGASYGSGTEAAPPLSGQREGDGPPPSLAPPWEGAPGAGPADPAVSEYERYLAAPWLYRSRADAFALPMVHHGLAELWESRGDQERAVHHYRLFLEQWEIAARDTAPLVEAVRRKLSAGSEGPAEGGD